MRATVVPVVLVCLLSAACSKSDPSLSKLGASEANNAAGAAAPTREVEPEEECAARCLTAEVGTTLTALDECMMDSCYGDPPMDDPTTASCDAVGAGKISYGVAARDRCVGRSCCVKARACADDPACASALACVVRCHAK